MGALRRAVPRGRLRRHRGAHLAQLPAPPVPLAALQQADRRVRRIVREPASVRARGDRRRALAGREGLGGRRAHQPQRLHPGSARHRRRDPRRADARGRRAPRLRQRHRRRLPQHLPRDPALGRARRLPRRPDRAGEGGGLGAAGVHRRRDQGSCARRGDPRLRQGGHGRDDARPDRRPGVREQGAGGARGRGRPLHPRQPGLHRPRLQGPADQLHGQPRRGPRGTAAAARRGRGAGALGRRGRRPGGDEGRRDAGPAGPLGHAARARRCARRAGEPDPAHARARRVRLDHARPGGAAAEGRRRGAARDRGDRGCRAGARAGRRDRRHRRRRPAARASRA